MDLKISPSHVVIVVPFDEPIVHLSFGLEQAISWFASSGVWRWNIARSRINEGVRFELNALIDPKPPSYAGNTALGSLVERDFIPATIPETERWGQHGGTRVMSEMTGPRRIKKFTPNARGESCLNSTDLRPDLSIAEYAWGLADTFVSAFVDGAMKGKHQLSLELSQIWFDLGFSQEKMATWIHQEYDTNAKVSTLRW
jgi:hypothetical protein